MANQNRTGVDHGNDEGTEPRRVERAASENATPAALDPNDIFASTGVVPYAWDVATDALTWGANARDVLEVADAALIASGGRYARLIDHKDGRSRVDAVMNSGMKDDGTGVPYEVQYALSRRRIPRRCTGSRTPAAGSPAPTERRRAPTASCG